MAERSSDLVQGTLDMFILKTLALEPMHGYGVAGRIEQVSNGVFHVNAGSLFVAFQRLQRAGLIRSEWKATENSRRAKYYLRLQESFSRSSRRDLSPDALSIPKTASRELRPWPSLAKICGAGRWAVTSR